MGHKTFKIKYIIDTGNYRQLLHPIDVPTHCVTGDVTAIDDLADAFDVDRNYEQEQVRGLTVIRAARAEHRCPAACARLSTQHILTSYKRTKTC